MKIMESHAYIKKVVKETEPLLRYDGKEDYESWSQRASAKLYELLGLPLKSCEELFEVTAEVDCKDYRRIDFNFQSEEGYFVPGSFLMPKAVKLPRPLVVCIQGHSTGMHISLGIERFSRDHESIANGRDFAVRAVQEGYCAIVLEQRYMGVCGQSEIGIPYCSMKNAALPALLMGRCAIGERVWDVQRLLDVVENHFSEYVDMKRIICMGNSGGGTVTFYVSCVDERIQLAMPSCSVCEFDDSIIPIHHCCCNYIPGIRKYFEMGDMAGLLASRKLVIVCGILDPDFPIAGVEKSYERARNVFKHLGKEDNCCIVTGPAGHQFYPDLAWPVANKLLVAE